MVLDIATVWPPCWPNVFPDSCRHRLPFIACQPMQIFNTRLSTTWASPPFARPFPPLTNHPQAPIPPLNPIFFSFFKPMYKYTYTYYCIVPLHPLPPSCKLPPSPFPQNTSHACQAQLRLLYLFKTLMHSCYFSMMHPGVILGLRGSMLIGMTNVDTITSKYSLSLGRPISAPQVF